MVTDRQLKTVSDNSRKLAGVAVPEKLGNTVESAVMVPTLVRSREKVEAWLAERREQQALERREGLRRAAELPVRHMTRNESLDRSGPWLEVYERILGQVGSGFLFTLIGGRGTGKTQLAVELALRAIDQNRTARYTTALEMFFATRAGFKDGKTELAGLRQFMAPSFLIVDEVCDRGDTAFEDRILTLLIDRRYRDMKDTILCANEMDDGTDWSPLRQSLGRSIVSRMAETGEVVRCEWSSFRGEPDKEQGPTS